MDGNLASIILLIKLQSDLLNPSLLCLLAIFVIGLGLSAVLLLVLPRQRKSSEHVIKRRKYYEELYSVHRAYRMR